MFQRQQEMEGGYLQHLAAAAAAAGSSVLPSQLAGGFGEHGAVVRRQWAVHGG